MSDCSTRAMRIRPENNPLYRIDFREFFTNPDLYLCGEPIKKVLENQFFVCLSCYIGCGLCYAQAAIAMFLLRDNPSARIVQGWARGLRNDEVVRHSWVECQYHNAWYVIDFAWLQVKHLPVPKEWYYNMRMTEAKPTWICQNRKFWRDSYNQLNFERLSRPETSWILPQLIMDYLPAPIQAGKSQHGFCFPSEDGRLRNHPAYGRIMIPQVFYCTKNGGPINQRVIKELMRPGVLEVSPQTRWQAADQHRRLLERSKIL